MGDAFPGNSATRACISGDGGTVAVGVTDIDSDPGYVEAYRWSESDEAWTQVGERVRKGEGNGTFARTVSLSHDGETLSVTGVTRTDHNGDPVDMSYAAVLRWNSFISQWDTRGSSGISMDGYHRHAAVSGDGRVLVAGAGVYALSCDASAPPAGGGRGGDVGDCTASLAPGETCTPTCGFGFDALDATCSETGRLTPGSCASSWCEADVTRGGFATGSAAADDIGCVPECVASNTCDCAANEFWDGSACASCPSGSFSAGGAATTTSCSTCTTDEYWNGQTCATCPGGAVGAVDGTMCATIWYSTADPSDVLTGSQGEVTGWTDATGNGYDIGTGAGSSAPTLETSTDGKYAVRVGGSERKYLRSADSFANLGLADIPQPFTLMAVIKINSGSGYLMDGYLMDKFAIVIDGGDNIFPYPTTDTAPTWRGTGGASLTGNCGFPSAGWGVHEWVFSDTAGETAIYKADGSAPCIDTQDTMSQDYSLTGLTIGEDGAMRINIMDADVSWREFMIIPGTLTREESARYREYLDDIAYSLPDLYEAYPGHYCTGRNEVGSFTGSLAECAAMCEASPECISFDFDASNADWTSTAQTDCWLSSTCTEEISDTNNRFTLLIKISAKAAAG
jgi:hypothetical protein